MWIWNKARLVIVFVVGMTVLAIGIAMIVLPGPAIVFIPMGLAILATEFVWARTWLNHINKRIKRFTGEKTPSGDEKESVGEP